MDKQLTKNFRRSEFACHDGCGLDSIHPESVAAIQQLRDLAEAPVIIKSGCRCPAHNKAVGGEDHSFHLPENNCRAIDWYIPGLSVNAMYVLACGIPAFQSGGIGRYYKSNIPFIHCDTRPYHARWSD